MGTDKPLKLCPLNTQKTQKKDRSATKGTRGAKLLTTKYSKYANEFQMGTFDHGCRRTPNSSFPHSTEPEAGSGMNPALRGATSGGLVRFGSLKFALWRGFS